MAEQTRRVFLDAPEICDSPDQCSDDVDLVLIANCNLDGKDHLEFALPGLEKGVATFIDKPLAYTASECRKIVDVAQKRRAPLFSASILRFEPTGVRFRDRIPEVGAINFVSIMGRGEAPAGMVHWISAVFTPRIIERSRSHIERIIAQLVSEFPAEGRVELLSTAENLLAAGPHLQLQ